MRILVDSLLACIFLLVAATGHASGFPEKARIVVGSTVSAALLHVAAEKGFFAAEGLDATIVPATHGKAALGLVAKGEADFAAAADAAFVTTFMAGAPLAVVASISAVSTDNSVIARRDRAIGEPRDLEGRTVGVAFGTSADYFLWAFMIRHRLRPHLVKLVDVPPGGLANALAAGSIDAAAVWSTLAFAVQAAVGENGITFRQAEIYVQSFLVVADPKVLAARPAAAERLVRALLRAERHMAEQPAETLAILAKRLGASPADLTPVLPAFTFRVGLLQSQLLTLEDQARWAMERRFVERGRVPNFLPQLHLRALLAVDPSRVTVIH